MYVKTSSPTNVIELEHYLEPVARQCINFRLDYRQVSEALKTVLVSIAKSEFAIEGKSQTDSRISLLTGVHRKDVRRLLGRGQSKTISRRYGLITKLIALWLETPGLTDEDGKPKPIPHHPHPAHLISFTDLAESLTSDICARSMWDECINSGIILMAKDGMVHLSSDYYPTNAPLAMQVV